jgi:hypothetical protein
VSRAASLPPVRDDERLDDWHTISSKHVGDSLALKVLRVGKVRWRIGWGQRGWRGGWGGGRGTRGCYIVTSTLTQPREWVERGMGWKYWQFCLMVTRSIGVC